MFTPEIHSDNPLTALAKPASPRRMLLFTVVLTGITIGLLALPPETSPVIFLGLIASLVASVVIIRERERQVLSSPLRTLQRWKALPWMARLCGLAGVVLMILAAYAFRPRPGSEPVTGFQYFFYGALFTGMALALLTVAALPPVVRHEPLYRRIERLREHIATGEITFGSMLRGFWQDETTTRPVRWQAVLAGAAMLLLVMQVNVLTGHNALPWMTWMLSMSQHVQMLLLVVGSSLVAWGLAGKSPAAPPRFAGRGEAPGLYHAVQRGIINGHVRAFLVVIFIALLARLWNLELWMTRFLDELHYMNGAARVWDGTGQPILTPFSQVTAFTWVYPYLQAWMTLLTGPSFSGVRLVSALFGVAEVAAVYFLGRQMFDKRTGLLAALVLATFPVHVHFSRIGINNIADPLFGSLALAFLARGMRHGQQRDFALAGWCLGWTQYFYEGGKLFYPLFVVCWLGWLFLFRRRGGEFRFPKPRYLAIFGFSALALIVPVYYTAISREINLAPRFTEMRDVQQQKRVAAANSFQARLQPVLDKLPLPLRALVELPDFSWFYGAKVGYVMPVLVPLFLLGMAQCFWRLRSPGGSVVFWWIIGAAAGIALISDSLSAPRYLVMIPAVALATGVGITRTLTMISPHPAQQRELPLHPPSSPRFAGGSEQGGEVISRRPLIMIVMTALLITVAQGGYYAFELVPNYYTSLIYNLRDGTGKRYGDTDDALLRAVQLPPNTDVYIVTRNLIWSFNGEAMVKYWRRPDMTIRHIFPKQLDDEFLRGLPHHRNQAFFLEADDAATLARIQDYFMFSPDPALNGVASPYPIPKDVQLIQYFAPATTDAARLDVTAVPPAVTPLRSADDVDE